MMFLVACFGDPVRRPFETIFRCTMVAAAGLFGAFFWGVWTGRTHGPQGHGDHQDEPEQENGPTILPIRRKVKRTRLGTVRHPDGRVDTMFEKIEQEDEE